MNYFIIGDEDTVLGFELVGVPGARAANPKEAEQAFQNALGRRNTGIIVITEAAADMIRPLVDRYVFTLTFPLIVEIPGPEAKKEGRKDIRSLVNEAIGIKI